MLLYIHIPFCDSKCFYCSFNSYVDLFHLKKQYMLALHMQLKEELKKATNITFKSIFIGGGTPSCVEASLYEDIFKTLKPFISWQTEITSEANPNSSSLKWLQDMKLNGVNRISFGVQSFNNEKLKFLGRNHNYNQAINAIRNAKEAGFVNINCDIIYDTAKDNIELIQNDLDIIATLPVNHISAYSLTIEEGTKFFAKKDVQIENIDMAKFIFESLDKLGFKQYEISNFAKSNEARSKHNFGYWQKEDYLGVGAGAVGAYKNKRYYPLKDVQKYISNPLVYEQVEDLNKEDLKFEKLFLGLRSMVGVNIDIFNKHELEKVKILEDENKVKIINNYMYNNDFLISDDIVLFLSD